MSSSGRAVSLGAIVFFALGFAAISAHAEEDLRSAFENGTRLESQGRYSEAADALEHLGSAHLGQPYADDALFEAALIAEEHLGDPARAERLYSQLTVGFPQSRLLRRARNKAEALASALRTGSDLLRDFEAILRVGSTPDAVTRMERLVSSHPEFALADRAIFWQGSTYAELGKEADAVAHFKLVEQRFPSSEWAGRAKKARADLALRHGRLSDAKKLYQELSRAPLGLDRLGGNEGLTMVRTARFRQTFFWVALIYFVAFILVHARAYVKSRPRGLPTEVLFYLPIAALFVLSSLAADRQVAWAMALIAAGGGLIVCLVAGSFGARPVKWREAILRAGMTALAVTALFMIAVHLNGLTDLVLETFKSGPER